MKFNNVNLYLLGICIILICFMIVILIFFLNEKNTRVQSYLPSIQTKVLVKENSYGSLVNSSMKVTQKDNVIIVNNFLNEDYFNDIKKQFESKKYESKNFMFRKASGVNFFNLHKEDYNGLVEIYYSNNILSQLSDIVEKPIQRISLADPNACSLLTYTNEGDHIDWHLDYSTYYGDRYVILLTIVNENENKNDLSNNKFEYFYKGKKKTMQMEENSLVIFKGSEILHQSTKIKKNERRILLSMVYCDICQEKKNVFNQIYEKTKNYILYN